MIDKIRSKLFQKSYLYNILALIISLPLLKGCMLYKDPEVPCLTNPKHFKPILKNKTYKLNKKWWENFKDNKLNCLVETALKNNYDYKISRKKIEIAKTYVTQNFSRLFPQNNLNFSSNRKKPSVENLSDTQSGTPLISNTPATSSIFNLQNLSASVTYEVDVWSQIRNSVKQAKADQAVAEANSQTVKLTLINNVVDGYFQIITLNSNLNNLKKQLRIANETIKLSTSKLQSGRIEASDVYINKNQAESLKSNINDLEKQKQIMINTLAYLVGEYPEDFFCTLSDIIKDFQIKTLIPPALPSEMLCNRPDIQSTFYQVLSYGYLEKQNIANFLPNISLTGNYGYASRSLSSLISNNNSYWNYGVYLSQFVFDYQARMSEYKRSKYQYESAILSYKTTVLNAFKEVNSALSSYKEDNEALLSAQKQVANLKELSEVVKAQYQGGLTEYSNYLSSELNYLQAAYNTAKQKLVVIEDVLQIYKSLGLGLDEC